LERLRRQHKIAHSLPPRRAQPPRLSVLEPGRRRAARRLAPVLVALVVVVAGVALAVALAL
jgi:fatty acid desaturase